MENVIEENNRKRFWKGFWQLADPKIWIASTVPMAVGGALAFGSTGRFNILWFFISLIAVYLIEIGKNAINECVDYESGVDRFIEEDKRTPFSGGKKTIVQGKLSFGESALIAFFTIFPACIIGLFIMFFREPMVFWIGLAGVFLSVFYSLPPFKFAYRGLGEVVVGITFGPLVLSGIFLVMTNTLDFNTVVVSLPIGFLIANVLWINQFPDYEADMKGGKRNWVVRLGKKKSVTVFAVLFGAAFIIFPVLTLIYGNPVWMLGLAGVPGAIQAVRTARKFYNDIPRLMAANAKMVQVYQITGIVMVVASLSNRFIHNIF